MTLNEAYEELGELLAKGSNPDTEICVLDDQGGSMRLNGFYTWTHDDPDYPEWGFVTEEPLGSKFIQASVDV